MKVAAAVKEKLGMLEPSGTLVWLREKLSKPDEAEKKPGRRKDALSRLPSGIKLETIADQSEFIKKAIAEVKTAALLGGILALLVLYLFLRGFRSTIMIGLAIPISVIATFLPMFVADVSLNIISLGGLALGLRMLVDNSIAVFFPIVFVRGIASQIFSDLALTVTFSLLSSLLVALPFRRVK